MALLTRIAGFPASGDGSEKQRSRGRQRRVIPNNDLKNHSLQYCQLLCRTVLLRSGSRPSRDQGSAAVRCADRH